MDYDETIAAGNITLGDTNNVTFTVEEKQRAFQKAWNDTSVVETKWNSSLTFDETTYQYALPSGVNNVLDIYIKLDNDIDEPEKISQNNWEIVDGNIQFKNGASNYITTGYTLYLKYNKKLDFNSDTLDSTALQEYVIALGCWNTLGLLGYKKANLFLKNDVTMSEMITLRRELERELNKLRAALPRAFVSI